MTWNFLQVGPLDGSTGFDFSGGKNNIDTTRPAGRTGSPYQ